MRYFDSGFTTALQDARDKGVQPVYFAWFTGKDRETGGPVSLGFWSRTHDIEISVTAPAGGSQMREYIGGCGLMVDGLQYVADLSDNPVTVSLSQIADAAQFLIRGLDLRLAHCEIHATSLARGRMVGAPQLQWVGIVDSGPISTPDAGGEGGISLSVRSEILAMLTATNPAKSSNAHQRRRAPGDRFCEFGSTVSSRKLQWYHKD